MSDTKKNLNHALIAQFSGQQATITTPRIYYRLTKCLNKAYLLNQIIFYSSRSTYCNDDWFYKCYEEWREEVFVSDRTLRTYFKDFVEDGLIEMRIAKVRGVRTPFFRPMMENISKAIAALIDEDNKANPPIPPKAPETGKNDLNKSCPKRKKLPDSQTEKIAVSNTIYTNNSSDKKTTTVNHHRSSSSFFTKKQQEDLLNQKLGSDLRSDETFLLHCQHHIEKQKNDLSKFQRMAGLKKILKNVNEVGEHFKSPGFIDPEQLKIQEANKKLQELTTEHQLYWSQFKNDRDFLKRQDLQGKEPKGFEEWIISQGLEALLNTARQKASN